MILDIFLTKYVEEKNLQFCVSRIVIQVCTTLKQLSLAYLSASASRNSDDNLSVTHSDRENPFITI